MTALAIACFALAALYAAVTLANLAIFRVPRRQGGPVPAVSVLIPARDEAGNIGPAIDAALASEGVEAEIVVMDDGSTDATAEIVRGRAARDPRVRLIQGDGLPRGWNGKQHACWRLAHEARHDVLVFVDADVRLAPEALLRLAGRMEAGGLDLVSGFPRQITPSLAETLVIPQIFVLLLGYLPVFMARVFRGAAFGAGCGQLMAVRRGPYLRAGGHGAIRTTMHDGLMLPKLMRRAGFRTDIVDATPLATCRMYQSWPEIWAGFSKNATEGMAKPVALPIWTILLAGGHILPYPLALAALLTGPPAALSWSLAALGLLLLARLVLALKTRQPLLSVLLHPAGVVIMLAVQWNALVGARRGRRPSWRGRSYDTP